MDEYIVIGLDDGRELRYHHISDFHVNRDVIGNPYMIYFERTDTVSKTMVSVYMNHVIYFERKVKED